MNFNMYVLSRCVKGDRTGHVYLHDEFIFATSVTLRVAAYKINDKKLCVSKTPYENKFKYFPVLIPLQLR